MTITNKKGKVMHEAHFLMPMEMHRELNKIIFDFKEFKHDNGHKKVDNLGTSELLRMLIQNFITDYNLALDPNLLLLEMLKEYRKGVKQ